MKIIKDGDERLLHNPKIFVCPKCGCVVEALDNEYYYEEGQLESILRCVCPTCENLMVHKANYRIGGQF